MHDNDTLIFVYVFVVEKDRDCILSIVEIMLIFSWLHCSPELPFLTKFILAKWLHAEREKDSMCVMLSQNQPRETRVRHFNIVPNVTFASKFLLHGINDMYMIWWGQYRAFYVSTNIKKAIDNRWINVLSNFYLTKGRN